MRVVAICAAFAALSERRSDIHPGLYQLTRCSGQGGQILA
jgi:hypothetical protein